MTGEAVINLSDLGLAADQRRQLLRKIIAGGWDGRSCLVWQSRRTALRWRPAYAVHRSDEPITSSWNGHEVALVAPSLSQHFAQSGHMDLNIILLNHDAGPDLDHQFVLCHQLAITADKQQQDVKSALTQGHGDTMRQQFALLDQQAERPKCECPEHQRLSALVWYGLRFDKLQCQPIAYVSTLTMQAPPTAAHQMAAKTANFGLSKRGRLRRRNRMGGRDPRCGRPPVRHSLPARLQSHGIIPAAPYMVTLATASSRRR